MKPITKLYLKVFLSVAACFFVLRISFDLLNEGDFKFLNLLIVAFVYGVFMSITMISKHKKKLQAIGIKEMTGKNLSVFQSRKVKSKLNKTELIEKLNSISTGMKNEEVENGIVLKTGVTWRSWGEKIKITLLEGTEFEYEITSKPKSKLCLLDYGNNIKNVNAIENIMNTIS